MFDHREPDDPRELHEALGEMGYDLAVHEDVEAVYASGGPFHALVIDLTDGAMAMWIGFCTALGAVLAAKASKRLGQLLARRHVHVRNGDVAAILTKEVPAEAIQSLANGLPDSASGKVVWDASEKRWKDPGY